MQAQLGCGKLLEMATTTLNPQQIETWRAFLAAYATASDRIECALREAGLPAMAWYDVLHSIYSEPEHRLRPFELADAIVMSRSGLSRLLDRIEAAGLIGRESCPSDRRGQHLVVTDEGVTMLRRMWPVYQAAVAEHFAAHVGDDSATVAAALGRIEGARRESACGDA